MKKKKQVEVQPVAGYTKEVEVTVCDFCGKESSATLGLGLSQDMTTCMICERHICRGSGDSCAKVDPEDDFDYPGCYCLVCYNLRFEKYKKDFDDLTERHYEEKESFKEKIKQESLKYKFLGYEQ